jgi:hypothetical protein
MPAPASEKTYMPNRLAQEIDPFNEPSSSAGYIEAAGSGVLVPEVITRAQYYSSPTASPSQRLLLAVLEDAIHCYQQHCGATKGWRRCLFREAKEWLFDSNSTAFMSCRTVCESLGIEPALLRRALREWRLKTMHGLSAQRLPRRMQCR